ncbi:MAG: hypothetical protein R6W70_00200 [bacterium]
MVIRECLIIFTIVFVLFAATSCKNNKKNQQQLRNNNKAKTFIEATKGLDYFFKASDLMKKNGEVTNKKKFRYYLEKTCENEFKMGCEYLAVYWEQGFFGKKDERKAYKYYEKACNLKSLEACGEQVRYLYLSKGGVETDLDKIRKLTTFLCEKDAENFTEDCHAYGVMLYNGTGGAKNIKKGIDILSDNCRRGNPHSCVVISKHFIFKENNNKKTKVFLQIMESHSSVDDLDDWSTFNTALVLAKIENKKKMLHYLRSAISKNEKWAEKAKESEVFKKYKKDTEFLEIINFKKGE